MLRKTIIDDAMVIANNTPSDGIADYDPNTSYQAGEYAVVPGERAIYETLMAVTGVSPPIGATNTPREWRYWRPINEWAMFNEQLGTFSESGMAWPVHTGNGIQFEIDPGGEVETLALLQLDADSVRVEMIDPTAGTVFDETHQLDGGSTGVDSWFQWFTVPLTSTKLEKLIVTGLPYYPEATLRVSIQGNPARCGVVIMGSLQILGELQYGSSVGIRDYSIKDRDEFGRPVILERGFSQRGSFDVWSGAGKTDTIVQVLSEYRATPTLWVGTDIYDSTIIFGFYQDHEVVLANYAFTELSIDIEGLING